ncbi:MAG: hypothetical protein K2Q09_09795, partial [Phycisphaerales bacterium]|nr:hypothetical protein [Phycisphaerales bacterium]
MSRTPIALALLAGAAVPALAQPANDMIANALPITIPSTVAGTTIGATNDFGLVGSCGNSAYAKDVWYRFDATVSRTVEFNTCSGTTYNSVLQAYRLDSLGNMTDVMACDDNGCSTQSRINFNAVAGAGYMIRVAGNGTSASGPFVLTATVPPPGHPPPAPDPELAHH